MPSGARLWLLGVALTAPALLAAGCEEEARAWRGSAAPASRAALTQCAARQTGAGAATAKLALAVSALEAKRYDEAAPLLAQARGPLALIADYVGFFEATQLAGQDKHAEAIKALEPVWRQKPGSIIAGRAALLAGKSYIVLGDSARAAQLLDNHESQLPQPAGALLAGEAWSAAGDETRASRAFAKVYFEYPLSPEAAKVPAGYRHGSAADYLLRADRGGPGRETAAKAEMEAVWNSWTAAERELAQAKLAELAVRGRRYAAARQMLTGAAFHTPAAAAERAWWLYQSARRLNLDASRADAMEELRTRHAKSERYLDALLAEAYRALIDNDYQSYEPLYQACVTAFPTHDRASFCHWKLTWSARLRNRSNAEAMLRDHLKQFPRSEKANTALYFLGRNAEARNDAPSARAYFDWVVVRYPNTYYALLAAQRLRQDPIRKTAASPVIKQWLGQIAWPDRRSFSTGESADAAVRRERAILLAMAGLDNYAEFELRQGARDEQAPVQLAMDLAEHMTKVGQPDKGLRYIKNLLPGYLFFPWEDAGDRFWRLAFPLAYAYDLNKYARRHEVDPFLIAGLIRQESEFNAKVVSRSNAYGLTQILPSTGRELSRRSGLRGFKTTMLFDPAVNLRLGTYYVQILLRSFGGSVEQVLAAYNGGGTRVRKWRGFGEFSEPAEFIETIPFDETREYVQSVLRNAAVYKRLYDGKLPSIQTTEDKFDAAPAPAARQSAPAKKKATPKRRTKR